MKAVTIVTFGEVQGLEIREIDPLPPPTADRVQVRVRAAALNRADILQRLGRYPAPAGYSQVIPGLEFAGEVDAIGSEVTKWTPGQRVFGIIGGGAQAEFVVVAEDQLVEIPANLDFLQAAAVPEAFITAHDALFTQAKLQMGEAVLIHAAGSGVGTAAIQLARNAGAKVFGTSRSKDKLERARKFGLDAAIVVAQDVSVIPEAVRESTKAEGVSVILDLVGAGYLSANLSALAMGGRMVLVGTTSGAKAILDMGEVMRKRITIVGTVLRARSAEEKAKATRLFAAHVLPLLADGRLKPVIDRIYELEEIREAHARLESNESFGKIVMVV